MIKKIEFLILVFSTFILIAFFPYAQVNVNEAVDDLLEEALAQIKALSANRDLKNIAVWKIEVDEKGLVNVGDLADRLNIALIDGGILKELAIDFTDVADRDSLKRLAAIYGINAFIYGKETIIEGNSIKVTFQIFDVSSDATIWENIVLGVGAPAEEGPAVTGSMEVTSTPDKAGVFLNSKYKGNTPLIINNLVEGRYKIEVNKNNYRVWEREVLLEEKENASIEATLHLMLASINFTSNLPQADVFLNGQKVGKTPITIKDLSLGEYKVRIAKMNLVKEEMVVLERDGENRELDFKIGGLVSIVSVDKPFAEIYLNGASVTTVPLFYNPPPGTPLTAHELPFGDYEVSVKKWGHKDWSKRISLDEDRDKEILKIQLEEESWHWATKYGSLVGGSISGGVAGYTYFLALQAWEGYSNAGRETPQEKIDEFYDTANTMNILALIFGILSGILFPVGLTLLVF